jgi:hypothetical protein
VLLRVAALALVAVGIAGCGGGTKSAATTTTTTNNLPPGCTVDEVNGIITGFLSHPQLAPPAMFQVYATYESDGGKYVTRKRAAALAHLRARHAAGEKLRLLQLRVSPQDVNHVRVTFEVTRFAPDFAARKLHGRVANGAGTIDCAHQQVAAWILKGP